MEVPARVFLKRMSKNVAIDEPTISKKGIKNYFDHFIQDLPQTDLKDALINQREDYIKFFISCVRKAARKHQTKGIQQNGKSSQAVAPKAADAKAKAVAAKPSAARKKKTPSKPTAYTVRQQIIQLLKSKKSADVLGKLMDGLWVDEASFQSGGVDRHCEMLMLTDGTADLHTLKNIMYLQFRSLKDESDVIISKKLKKKASRRLQALAKFLRMCHLRRVLYDKDSKTFPSYADLVTGLLSIYLDLFLTASRDQEVTGKEVRQTCNLVKQLTRDLGEKTLDLLLQMTATDSQRSASCLSPLVRFLLKQKPLRKSSTHYLRYILTVAMWCDVLSDLDDIVLETRQIGAPLAFVKWAAEWEPSLREEFPHDTKFKGRAVTAYLLDDADSNLRSLLKDAIANYERNGENKQDEDTGASKKKLKKKKKVTDTDSKVKATRESEDTDEGVDLFTIDRGSTAEKTPHVVQQQKGRQTENTMEVFDLTGLDSTAEQNASTESTVRISSGKNVQMKGSTDAEEVNKKKKRKRKKKVVGSATKVDGSAQDSDEAEEAEPTEENTNSGSLFAIDRGVNGAVNGKLAHDAEEPKKKRKKKMGDSSSQSEDAAKDFDGVEDKSASKQNSSSSDLFVIDRGDNSVKGPCAEEPKKKRKKKNRKRSSSQGEDTTDGLDEAEEDNAVEQNTSSSSLFVIDRGDKAAAEEKMSSPIVLTSQDEDVVEVFDLTNLGKAGKIAPLQKSVSDDLFVIDRADNIVGVKDLHGSEKKKKKVSSNKMSDQNITVSSEGNSDSKENVQSESEELGTHQILAGKAQRRRTFSENLPSGQASGSEKRKRITCENVSTDRNTAAKEVEGLQSSLADKKNFKASPRVTSTESHNVVSVISSNSYEITSPFDKEAAALKASSPVMKSPKPCAQGAAAMSHNEIVSDSSDTGEANDMSFVQNSVSETDSQAEIAMIPDLRVHLKQSPSGGVAARKGTPNSGSIGGEVSTRKRKLQVFSPSQQAEAEETGARSLPETELKKKRKSVEQSKSPVAAGEALKETPKNSMPKETLQNTTPKETPKNSTPKEAPKSSTPKEASKSSTPKSTTPKEAPKSTTPKETPKSASGKQTPKELKETTKSFTPEETPKSSTPKNSKTKETPKSSTPKNSKPKETPKSLTPKNSKPKETPKGTLLKETPTSSASKVTPKSPKGKETPKISTPRGFTEKKTPVAKTEPTAKTPKSTTPICRRTRARKKSPPATTSSFAEVPDTHSESWDASQGLKSSTKKDRSRRDSKLSSPRTALLNSEDSTGDRSSHSQGSLELSAKRRTKNITASKSPKKGLSESSGDFFLHSEEDSDVVVQRKSRRMPVSSEDTDSNPSVDGSGSPARGRRVSLPVSKSKSLLGQVQKKSLRRSVMLGVDLKVKAESSESPKTRIKGREQQETETRFTKLKEEPEAASSPKRGSHVVEKAAGKSPSKSSPSPSGHDIETRSKTPMKGYNLRRSGKISG